jgi:hypothetical protein
MTNIRRFAVFIALAGMGCATTATVSHDGVNSEVKIEGSTPSSLNVSSEESGRSTINKDGITDIDHPGNVHATIGAALVAYGILNIAVGYSKCDEKGAAFCTGVFTPAAVGLGMFTWGMAVWYRSSQAAGGLPSKLATKIAPFMARVDGHNYTGAGLTLHY